MTSAQADVGPIPRDKALTLPVELIERIDLLRSDTPFSQYVIDALGEYLERHPLSGGPRAAVRARGSVYDPLR